MTINELKTWIEALECVETSDAKVYIYTGRDGHYSKSEVTNAFIENNGCQQDPHYYLVVS